MGSHKLSIFAIGASICMSYAAWADIGGIGASRLENEAVIAPVTGDDASIADPNPPKPLLFEDEPAAANPPQQAVREAPQVAEAKTDGSVVPETSKPLLIIRFNQPRVYYQRALTQAVQSAERTSSGIHYHIVSYVPMDSKAAKADRSAQSADANMRSVLNELNRLGVSPTRIRTSTQVTEAGSSQEIRMFVE